MTLGLSLLLFFLILYLIKEWRNSKSTLKSDTKEEITSIETKVKDEVGKL